MQTAQIYASRLSSAPLVGVTLITIQALRIAAYKVRQFGLGLWDAFRIICRFTFWVVPCFILCTLLAACGRVSLRTMKVFTEVSWYEAYGWMGPKAISKLTAAGVIPMPPSWPELDVTKDLTDHPGFMAYFQAHEDWDLWRSLDENDYRANEVTPVKVREFRRLLMLTESIATAPVDIAIAPGTNPADLHDTTPDIVLPKPQIDPIEAQTDEIDPAVIAQVREIETAKVKAKARVRRGKKNPDA